MSGGDSEDGELYELEEALFGTEEGSQEANSAIFDIEIDSAFQGEEAVDMVRLARDRGQPYFMAFVDVRMPPGIDGIETIKQLWRLEPQLSVVVCTAFADYSWKDIVAELGASPDLLILRKPFDSIEVRQLVTAMHAKTEQRMVSMNTMRRLQEGQREERKRAEQAHAILDILEDGIMVVGHRGSVMLKNRAARSMLVDALASGAQNVDERERQVGEAVWAWARESTAHSGTIQLDLGAKRPLVMHLYRIDGSGGESSSVMACFMRPHQPHGRTDEDRR